MELSLFNTPKNTAGRYPLWIRRPTMNLTLHTGPISCNNHILSRRPSHAAIQSNHTQQHHLLNAHTSYTGADLTTTDLCCMGGGVERASTGRPWRSSRSKRSSRCSIPRGSRCSGNRNSSTS